MRKVNRLKRTDFLGLVLALCCAQCFAQSSYLRTYQFPGNVKVKSADLTPDGGLIVAATVDTMNALVRLDASGNILWSRTYTAIGTNTIGSFDGSVFNMRFKDVAAVDSGFVVVGDGEGAEWPAMHSVPCAVRMDALGTPQAGRSSTMHIWSGNATAVDANATGVLVLVREGSVGGGRANLWRLNPATLAPIQNYNTTNGGLIQAANALKATPDGGAVFEACNYMIVKYDAAFTVEWDGQWSELTAGLLDGLVDGSVLFADTAHVVRFQPSGGITWSKRIPSAYGSITGMALRSDGSTLLAGPHTDGSAWLAHLDVAGSADWALQLGQAGDDLRPVDLMIDQNGRVRVVGTLGSDPVELFVLADDGSGAVTDCTSPDALPGFVPFSLSPAGTLSHTTGSSVLDFSGPVEAAPVNTYGNAGTQCYEGALLVQGTLFHDADLNGTYDNDEACFPNLLVGLQPDDLYTSTNTACAYDLLIDQPGTHVVAPAPLEPWWSLTTDSTSYTLQYNGGDSTITGLDYGFTPNVDTTVLNGVFITSPIVCNNFFGTAVQGWLHVLNTGTTQPDVVVALALDSLLPVISSEPPVDSIIGHTVYWHLNDIPYYNTGDIHMELQSSSMLSPSDTVHGTGVLLDPGTLDTLDIFDWAGEVVCPYDPNDKLVTPVGQGPLGSIPPDTPWLTYTVRFQNTGNAPATDVSVQDQLSPHLDPLTLQLLGTSHPVSGIDLVGGGLVRFRFNNIMLPDSASDEAGSHGEVTFRVHLRAGLHHMDSIPNNAAIFFDANEAVVTNSVRNTIVNCAEATWSSLILGSGGQLWASSDVWGEMSFTYQWMLNGAPIEGATGSFWHPEENGAYTVILTDPYGCNKQSEPVEVILTGTGTNAAPTMHVFPNPMSDAAHIVLPAAVGRDTRVDVLDMSARVIRTLHGNGTRELTIERDGLMSGLYLLRIQDGQGPSAVVRLVVE